MKNYYLVKVAKHNWKKAEALLMSNLVDRKDLVSLHKLLVFHKDPTHYCFVIGGESHSSKVVLGNFKKKSTGAGIECKLFSCEIANIEGLNDLIWLMDSNELGSTVKTYTNDSETNRRLQVITNDFLIKQGLMSKYVLCKTKHCEGFCEAVELSSIKGLYRCEFCGTEVELEGPLLLAEKAKSQEEETDKNISKSNKTSSKKDKKATKANKSDNAKDKKPRKIKHFEVKHLTVKEQLYLVGLYSNAKDVSTDKKEEEANETVTGEQMFWKQTQKTKVTSKCKHKRVRASFLSTLRTYGFEVENLEAEQVSWIF